MPRAVRWITRSADEDALGLVLPGTAEADGYTVMVQSASHSANPAIYKSLPYDPLKDLVPVALLSSSPFFLVVKNDSPVKTVADLVALAKEKPNALNYGSGGPGSMHHLSTELLQSLAGIQMTHVPYKATPPAMNDLIAGHIQVLFGDTTSVLPLIQQGTVRGIAVTSKDRLASLPELPTVAEAGLAGYESSQWYGVLAPAGTAVEILGTLNTTVDRIMQSADMKARMAKDGLVPIGGTRERFALHIREEIDKWAKVIKASGATID